MTKRIKALLFAFGLLALPLAARATAPVVLNIDYTCGDPVIHIGSSMTVYMSAIDPIQTINNISVTASTGASITLGSVDLQLLGPSNLYVTDGIRTWIVPFAGGGANTITFGDGNLILIQAPFTGANYTTLVN